MEEVKTGVNSVWSEVGEMRRDMNENFAEMAKRYDTISDGLKESVSTMKTELLKTRENLTRAVDNLSKLIEESIKTREKS